MAGSQTVTAQVQVLPTRGAPLGFLLYLPPGYKSDSGQRRWPLLLFLHGAGERGSNLQWVARHGPPKLIEQGRVLPFVVVSPQCPSRSYWDHHTLARVVDHAVATWSIDTDRIYVTGMSMGGYGTWMLLAHQPDRFAAAAMVCGGGNPTEAGKLAHLPIWLFHGEKDGVVPVSESVILARALESAGGKARLTLYPDADHDSWTQTYDNPELYEWFLQHRRTR